MIEGRNQLALTLNILVVRVHLKLNMNKMKLEGKKVTGIQLVTTSRGYNKTFRASYNRYRVMVWLGKTVITPIESLFTKKELKELPYWSPKSEVMAMTCWGTSQEFQAQLALATFFGIENTKKDWGEYCREVKSFIKTI